MYPEQVTLAFTFILSLIFDLIPGVKERWEGLADEQKRAGWLLGCFLIPAILWSLACFFGFDPMGYGWDCSVNGFVGMIMLALAAYGLGTGSHSVYKLVKSALGK